MNVTKRLRTIIEWAAVLAVALGATLLLTSAAAYAGDSWVLWHRWDTFDGVGQYYVEAAYADRAECVRAIGRHLDVWRGNPYVWVKDAELADGKGETTHYRKYRNEARRADDLASIQNFVCLPVGVYTPDVAAHKAR